MRLFIPVIFLLAALILPSPGLFALSDTVTGNAGHHKVQNGHGYAITDSGFVELPDSIREKQHSPTKATLMSTFLPGLGQAYNRRYWKIPIIYAGFGVFGYLIYFNAKNYSTYKNAYIESANGITDGKYSDLVAKYTGDQLISEREFYRRNLEITCIFTALWYGLNILDATVDAHLYTFNISDRLTMKVQPEWQPAGLTLKPAPGVRLSLHF